MSIKNGQGFEVRAIENKRTEVTDLPSGQTMVMNCTQEQIRNATVTLVRDDKLIQEAFPFLNPDEREFLLTGITPEQWDAIFGKEE